MFVFLCCRKNFLGTQKRVRIRHSKRAIGVRVIEVFLYSSEPFCVVSGAVFASIACLESVASVAGTVIANTVYENSIGFFKGFVFFVFVICNFISCILMLWVFHVSFGAAPNEHVKLRRFRLFCVCAKFHSDLCFPFLHSVVSNDSVFGQWRRGCAGWSGPSLSLSLSLAYLHVLINLGFKRNNTWSKSKRVLLDWDIFPRQGFISNPA